MTGSPQIIEVDLTIPNPPPNPTLTLPSGSSFTFNVKVNDGALPPVCVLTLQEDIELKMSPVAQLREKGVTCYVFPCFASLINPEAKGLHLLVYRFTVPESLPQAAQDSGTSNAARDQPTSSGKINVSGDLGDGRHSQLRERPQRSHQP